jgi:hypothetical protein
VGFTEASSSLSHSGIEPTTEMMGPPPQELSARVKHPDSGAAFRASMLRPPGCESLAAMMPLVYDSRRREASENPDSARRMRVPQPLASLAAVAESAADSCKPPSAVRVAALAIWHKARCKSVLRARAHDLGARGRSHRRPGRWGLAHIRSIDSTSGVTGCLRDRRTVERPTPTGS